MPRTAPKLGTTRWSSERRRRRGAKEVPIGKAGRYRVSAGAVERGRVLGQRTVDEITVIAHLLDVLALEGGVVTIDALGGQSDIAEPIVSQHTDDMRAVNQGPLKPSYHRFIRRF